MEAGCAGEPGGALAQDAARALLSGQAVRARARQMLSRARAGDLAHFSLDLARLRAAVDYVAGTIAANYPTRDVPLHSRWRHFAAGGVDRWGALAREADWAGPAERARAAVDLTAVSVLLDAGAGPAWRYRETRTGATYVRSEGLAVASLRMFADGLFSAAPDAPLRADASALRRITPAALAAGFQAGPGNPLVGLDGRAALLNRLGTVLAACPDMFGSADEPRPGGLYDGLAAKARGGRLPAAAVLDALLTLLGPIWPGRIELEGINLGDTWRHPLIEGPAGTEGLVPFHKLSQWLAYSLVEPLFDGGLHVIDLDALTGLPEYRNGGLFLDLGVLRLKEPHEAALAHAVGSVLVVEWRALTVALLDELAPLVRARLGLNAAQLPLVKVLEGGTWAAGRRIAHEKRADGAPPLRVISDGTVF